jgi:hypothetical protein
MAEYPSSKRGFLMKGALIELKPGPLFGVMPSITIFQYNPASLTRSLTPADGPAQQRAPPAAQSAETGAPSSGGGQADGRASVVRPNDPQESFDLKLVIDAFDDLNEDNKLGLITGVADRIASLELMTYPDATLFEKALDAIGDAIGGALGLRQGAETANANVLLFYFGPGKIVPVKINSMTIDEQQFHSATLYPIRAEVSVSLTVLRESELDELEQGVPVTIARGCYIFTREQKSVLATIGGPLRLIDSALTAINPDLGDIL